MKKYLIFYMYNFCIQYFKKTSETLLDTQELQYPSDFWTASSSSVLANSENLQKENINPRIITWSTSGYAGIRIFREQDVNVPTKIEVKAPQTNR